MKAVEDGFVSVSVDGDKEEIKTADPFVLETKTALT